MKTIKLIMIKGEIDTSAFNQNKFPNSEDVIKKIAQKLKKPISEIRKNKSMIDAVLQNKIDAFIDTKISKFSSTIESIINKKIGPNWPKTNLNEIVKDINADNGFNGWQEKTKYNPKTKTFNVNLCYKNRLAYEIYTNLQTIRINEDFLNGKRMKPDGEYESFSKTKYLMWYGKKSWQDRIDTTKRLKDEMFGHCPKFVKVWLTKDGKKEIEFIEKTLEELGKIKIEVYSEKNKKLDTFYVQYKTTGLTFDIPNNLKKQFKLN